MVAINRPRRDDCEDCLSTTFHTAVSAFRALCLKYDALQHKLGC